MMMSDEGRRDVSLRDHAIDMLAGDNCGKPAAEERCWACNESFPPWQWIVRRGDGAFHIRCDPMWTNAHAESPDRLDTAKGRR